MSTLTAVSANRKPSTFRLPNGTQPAYVLVPGIDPEGGLVAVFHDGSYSPSWMPQEARDALAVTARALTPATCRVEVARRGNSAWVCRCACGWVTGSFDTRSEAREAKAAHRRDVQRDAA
jgi:hypothetical protein